MKADILVTLIKEVVKNEVKQQVKEEITKLIKSGALTVGNVKKPAPTTLKEITSTDVRRTNAPTKLTNVTRPAVKPRQYSNNSVINDILNQTQPFTSSQRAEGGSMVNEASILDSLQPNVSMEGEWETMDYRSSGVTPQMQIDESNPEIAAVTKALTRDYSELVKRFK